MKTHAVVANTVADTPDVKGGALCYVKNFSLATNSVEVYVVNREGQWVSQWRPGASLTRFRAKIVPKSHPAFGTALAPPAARARAATLTKAFPSVPSGETETDSQDLGEGVSQSDQ